MLTYRETCLQWTSLIYKMNTRYYRTHQYQAVSHFSSKPYFPYNMNLIHVCIQCSLLMSGLIAGQVSRVSVLNKLDGFNCANILYKKGGMGQQDAGLSLRGRAQGFSPATLSMIPAYFQRKQKENRTRDSCSILPPTMSMTLDIFIRTN